MNRTITMAAAGAVAVLAIGGGVALALGNGVNGQTAGSQSRALVLSTTASSTEDSPTSDPTPDRTTPDTPTRTSTPAVDSPQGGIGVAAATRIALAHVGGGHVTGVEQEVEHGRLEWKIRITDGGRRVDVRVDAGTGTVTRVEADGHDDSGSGHGDDYSGSGRSDGGDDSGGSGRG